MKWVVPLTFEMGCDVIAEGDNPHEAIRNALAEFSKATTGIPANSEYIEDSVRPSYGPETVNDVRPVQ